MSKLNRRSQMLMDNDLEWYVCTTIEGELALHHSSALSAILECGEPASEYGFETVEQCWNGDDLSDENDWEDELSAYISDKEDSGNGVMWFKYDGITYGWTDDGRLLDEDGIPTDQTTSESLAVIDALELDHG